METFYLYENELDKESILTVFKNKIQGDKRYKKTVEDDLLSYSSSYYIYPFIKGSIKNLHYLVVRDGKEYSGVIDAKYALASKEFILAELDTNCFSKRELDIKDYDILNREQVEEYKKRFIERLLDKTTDSICSRHNLFLKERGQELDIAPIREFDEYDIRFYLENVYVMTYHDRFSRKTYQSIYSPLKETFYVFDYLKSETYEAYFKQYKRPIVYIPKKFRELYYEMSFDVYVKTIEELKYITPNELLTKLKKNIQYKEYSKYKDYLLQLIFYFRKRSYLKELSLEKNDFLSRIFFDYLTLRYNEASGYQLAGYVKENLIEDDYVRLLEFSARLKNSFARKALFEYYSHPRNYKETLVKRYG